MNYPAFTNGSLTVMYEGIRGALESDDARRDIGKESRFRVRETPEWKKHARELESEMLKCGMFFDVMDWSEGWGHYHSRHDAWVSPATAGAHLYRHDHFSLFVCTLPETVAGTTGQ
jgi:hypothetical protein